MDNEELMKLLENAPWGECSFCKDLMPFEIFDIPNVGPGAACMNCGTPSPDTQMMIEQAAYQEEINRMFAEMGTTPEEIMAWQEAQMAKSDEELRMMEINDPGSTDGIRSEMDYIDQQGNDMYNSVANMSDEEFESWLEQQESGVSGPNYQ